MRKQNKKGFTIVELVIVIAVIAILVAVLVPTFVTLVRKAQVSNDRQLVKNLNTALQTESQSKEAPKTMQAALDIAAEYGYDVTKINAKASDNEILWDSLNNVYCYFDKDGGVEYIPEAPKAKDTTPVDYWVISDKVSDTYSTYYTGTAANVPEELTKGFDAGKVEGITALKYVGTGSAQTVVIRTNGGTLTIDAKTDTVHHYDDLDNLTVTAVDPTNSYHEHGKVKVSAVIKDGHFVIEENGYANELVIPESATAVTVDIKPQGTVVTAIVDNAAATVAIDAGATVGQIVAEDTSKISGAGATEAKENAIAKTLVYNTSAEGKMTLKEALEARKEYIVLAEDITVTKWNNSDKVGASITYSVTLDGAGHTMTGDATVTRGIWIDENNVTLNLKNIKIVGSKLERGVQVNGGVKGAKLVLDQIETSSSYYAINVCNNADVDISITNSKITGYGAINLWSANYSVYISDSELYGVNDKSYNADGWNDFATVILEGDTTNETTDHSSTIDVKIVNTKISATTNGQGNKQYCILFNDQCTANNVELIGCTIEYKEEENTFKYLDNGEGNSLVIDGTKVN